MSVSLPGGQQPVPPTQTTPTPQEHSFGQLPPSEYHVLRIYSSLKIVQYMYLHAQFTLWYNIMCNLPIVIIKTTCLYMCTSQVMYDNGYYMVYSQKMKGTNTTLTTVAGLAIA